VKRDGKYLFTYVEPSGAFTTTDDASAIPPAARRLVRVTDPARAATDRRDLASVYVVDLDELERAGKVSARVLSRLAFETAALAQLPPGQSSLLADRAPAEQPEPADPDAAAATSAEAPVVIIYGTSWCGACREARRYLSERKIPFADRDVEKDPAAARELATKAARLGVPADRVPVLEVRGRLLIGFDRARLEALLGEPA
jgi:glutaredoxin 3